MPCEREDKRVRNFGQESIIKLYLDCQLLLLQCVTFILKIRLITCNTLQTVTPSLLRWTYSRRPGGTQLEDVRAVGFHVTYLLGAQRNKGIISP